MIDLHCHILPGIDDGAQSIEDSIELIHAALADGITRIICTPHIQLGRFDNTIETISTVFNQLKEQTIKAGIDIELSFFEILIIFKPNSDKYLPVSAAITVINIAPTNVWVKPCK